MEMNKHQAAEFLGVSVRALERYTKTRKISARYEKGRTKPTPVYDEAELREFKSKIETPTHSPAVIPPDNDSGTKALSPLSQTTTLTKNPDGLGQLITAFAMLDERMLTLKEAAEFSGISEGALRRDIKAGQLPKYKGYGRGDRVKKSELRAFMQGLQPDE
jgi:excisionase family DNA binding protein